MPRQQTTLGRIHAEISRSGVICCLGAGMLNIVCLNDFFTFKASLILNSCTGNWFGKLVKNSVRACVCLSERLCFRTSKYIFRFCSIRCVLILDI